MVATYTKFMILSSNDPRIRDLKYRIGDKFLLKKEALKNPEWEEEMVEDLELHVVILEIDGYEKGSDGEIGYSTKVLFGPPNFFAWWLPEKMLDTDFIRLGKDPTNIRFALLDE